MDDKSFNIRVPKRWVRVAMIVGVTALIVAPLTAIASHSFTDVPDGNTFHDDIAWLADAGVTKGCNPPDNTEFCPDDNVTRGQMSAFMHRFAQFIGAADGTPAQADNATTADSATNADNATTADSATTAEDAQMIDGRAVGCTAGQTEYAGECWESEPRDSIGGVFFASEACGDEGGRLPEALELRRFGQISAVTSPNNEITTSVYYDGNFRTFHLTGDELSDHSTLDSGTYRCVFPLIETAATPASVSPQGDVAEDGS